MWVAGWVGVLLPESQIATQMQPMTQAASKRKLLTAICPATTRDKM